jgi:hypothetical protein
MVSNLREWNWYFALLKELGSWGQIWNLRWDARELQ